MDVIVNEIFQHWWLIWVIPPLVGAISVASGRGRRQRRREELRRYQNRNVARTAWAPREPDEQTRRADQVRRALQEHEQTEKQWLEYELDASKLIDFPTMTDVRQPLTAEFIRAKRRADSLRPSSADQVRTEEEASEYRNAVTDFQTAFDLAEREAHRVKDHAYAPAERQRLATAKKLLKVASDESATPSERQIAFSRVRRELDGLITIPDSAMAEIETKIRS